MRVSMISGLLLLVVLTPALPADHHAEPQEATTETASAMAANRSAVTGNKVKVEFTYDCEDGNEYNDLEVWPPLVLICANGKNCKNTQIEWTVPQGLKINNKKYVLKIIGKERANCFPTQMVEAGNKPAGKPVKDKSGKPFDICIGLDWEYGAIIHEEDDSDTVCAEIDPGVIIRD